MCVCVCVCVSVFNRKLHTYPHIYIYIYMDGCVRVRTCVFDCVAESFSLFWRITTIIQYRLSKRIFFTLSSNPFLQSIALHWFFLLQRELSPS